MTEPSDIEKALAWLIDNSEGVKGLRLDGEVMPWDEVLALYVPALSADFAAPELADEGRWDRECSGCASVWMDRVEHEWHHPECPVASDGSLLLLNPRGQEWKPLHAIRTGIVPVYRVRQ